MAAIALGLLALVLAVATLRWLAGADPKALAKGLRWLGAIVLLLAAAGLAAIDRVGLAMLAGSMAWGLFTGGHVWPQAWHYRFGSRGSPGTQDTSSKVTTEWLDMELDQATGTMRGTVLKGAFAGSLDVLSQAQLADLMDELNAADGQSARLLEAYMERRFGPDWRAFRKPSSARATGMTRTEALAALGLSEGATEADIRAAHRRLILQTHPDRGGSSYLAAKINEAKDVLLGA